MSEIDKEVGRVDPALVNHAPSGHGPTGFDPAREDHALIESCAQIAEEYAGEQSYHSYYASAAGNQEAAMFYHRRFEMLLTVAARIRSKVGPKHVLDMSMTRPGMKRWSAIIAEAQLKSLRDSGRLPEGEDPKGLSAEQARAAAQPHRPNSTSLNQGADDGR